MLDQNFSEINHDASPWTPALKYGLIRGLIAISLALIMYLSGSYEGTMQSGSMTSTLVWLLSIALTALFVFLAVKEHKANRGGYITIGQSIGVGVLTALVYGVIAAIWAYIFFNFIFTGYEEMMTEAMVSVWEEQGMSDDEIEQAMAFAGMATSPMTIVISSIIAPLFTGLFAGLITGAVVKTD